jgi:mannose-6-phosphate isomerase-like protein (cupin superfamily)
MRITHLYTGKDDQSHFDEIEIQLESRGSLGFFTDPTGLKAFFFREVSAGYRYTWHTVVCREYVVTLEGRAEIEVGSGEKRRFGKGDVLLAEDISGQGHKTRVIGKKPWRQVFITLE